MGYGDGDTSFQAAGGEVGVQKLVEKFYQVMSEEQYARTIREMHPKDLTDSIDKLSRFLCGWLGGPKRYSEKYGGIAIPPAHGHLPIDDAERDAWLKCMSVAVAAQPFDDEFKVYLMEQLAVPAGRIVVYQKNRSRASS